MAIARAQGKLFGKLLKLPEKQQKELVRMHVTDEYSISDLAELCAVFRLTVYRNLYRTAAKISPKRTFLPPPALAPLAADLALLNRLPGSGRWLI